MKNNLFGYQIYQYFLSDWDLKKEKIKSMIDDSRLVRGENQWFNSDRHTNNNSYGAEFVNLIQDDLQLFIQDINTPNIGISKVWTVKYDKGDFHPPHTHSASGYSAVLYLEYIKEKHTPVWFVDPITDPITDQTNYCVPDVYEGMIVICPSNVLHFTYPNTSEEARQIVGFDIRIGE